MHRSGGRVLRSLVRRRGWWVTNRLYGRVPAPTSSTWGYRRLCQWVDRPLRVPSACLRMRMRLPASGGLRRYSSRSQEELDKRAREQTEGFVKRVRSLIAQRWLIGISRDLMVSMVHALRSRDSRWLFDKLHVGSVLFLVACTAGSVFLLVWTGYKAWYLRKQLFRIRLEEEVLLEGPDGSKIHAPVNFRVLEEQLANSRRSLAEELEHLEWNDAQEAEKTMAKLVEGGLDARRAKEYVERELRKKREQRRKEYRKREEDAYDEWLAVARDQARTAVKQAREAAGQTLSEVSEADVSKVLGPGIASSKGELMHLSGRPTRSEEYRKSQEEIQSYVHQQNMAEYDRRVKEEQAAKEKEVAEDKDKKWISMTDMFTSVFRHQWAKVQSLVGGTPLPGVSHNKAGSSGASKVVEDEALAALGVQVTPMAQPTPEQKRLMESDHRIYQQYKKDAQIQQERIQQRAEELGWTSPDLVNDPTSMHHPDHPDNPMGPRQLKPHVPKTP